MQNKLSFILLVLFFGATNPAHAVSRNSLINRQFRDARSAMGTFLTRPNLVYVEGKKSKMIGCPDLVEYKFAFQSDETFFTPASGGYVGYSAISPHNCKEDERTVTDTSLARPYGYSRLSDHDDLDQVELEWSEVLDRIKQKYPDFLWANYFQIYSPLVPGSQNRVYYEVLGQVGQHAIRIFMDATTGEIH